ncbi:Thioredoxin-like protein AAED1, chloroplastic [Apostasia shenzhenica]|uniref:Thioredoxin-like protein AAED1, chloroplastic n=1 Tax=Apostasia shenzhenica TaxID=1088818 RepID=A0A2I0BFC0_9ASPA|nr:Thioredoxin-like protein AAED1, chloroplastic [Apostasia shenzhenica]
MALVPSNSLLAPPLALRACIPSLPFVSVSPVSPSQPRWSPAARRIDPAMGSSSSSIARASPSSHNPSAAGFDERTVDALGNVQVFAVNGEPVFFRDLWDQKEGMAVVALLRHFGCICCWELASELKDLIPRFDSDDVKLIAVGIGTIDRARILLEELPFPLDYLYADPDRKAYKILSLYYGLGRTFFNPASTKVFSRIDSLKRAGRNYTISATPDDKSSVLQQGGVLVFKGKELLYARKDEGTGDHAPLDEILDICCKVPAA